MLQRPAGCRPTSPGQCAATGQSSGMNAPQFCNSCRLETTTATGAGNQPMRAYLALELAHTAIRLQRQHFLVACGEGTNNR